MSYQRIPRIVEAFRFGIDEEPSWYEHILNCGYIVRNESGTVYVRRRGRVKGKPSYKKTSRVHIGDYIVYDEKQKRVYCVEPEDFEALYLDLDKDKVIYLSDYDGYEDLVGW